MHIQLSAFLVLIAHCVHSASSARASFHVQYPWLTRAKPQEDRTIFQAFDPFCGDIIHNPQRFSGYQPTFVAFSGNAGDLVSIYYTRNRVPRSRADFVLRIVEDVPISTSGHLCFDIQMPTPFSNPEYGVLLFEARDPSNAHGEPGFFCSDVKLLDIEILGKLHPAMCAANNETLIPMPDEWL